MPENLVSRDGFSRHVPKKTLFGRKERTTYSRFWVHGCEPGRVSDGSRLALCQTLSIECPSSIFLWPVYFVIPVPLFVVFCVFVFFFCSHWSLVDVPLISFCPADHVPDWQPCILLDMVEARSVNVKKTTIKKNNSPYKQKAEMIQKILGKSMSWFLIFTCIFTSAEYIFTSGECIFYICRISSLN